MGELPGTLAFVAIIIGVLVYTVRSYASPRGTDEPLGLDADELASRKWIGEIDGSGATAIVSLTSKGRLVVSCEAPDGTMSRLAFDFPDDVVVRHLGHGTRRVRAGASVCFEVAGRGAVLRILVHESARRHLAEWETAAAGAA